MTGSPVHSFRLLVEGLWLTITGALNRRKRDALKALGSTSNSLVQTSLRFSPWMGILLLTILFAPWQVANGACYVVTPNGSGSRNGADWNNAYAGLPSTLVRGAVYYLGDGSYGGYTFDTKSSGSSTVEIRKAQTYDNCTSTGWNTSTMGSTQAVFTSVVIDSSYFTLNGNGQQTAPGCGNAPGSSETASPPNPAGCGIKVDDSGCSGGSMGCSYSLYPQQGASNYVIKYVEWLGSGNNTSEQIAVFGANDGGTSTFTHMFMHNAGCVYLQDGGAPRTVSYSYFWGNRDEGSGCHGQAEFYGGAESNGTNYSNVYRDIAGTAIWTFAEGPGTHTGWTFYDDVIWNDNPGAYSSAPLNNGVLACINSGVNCTGFNFYQNTMIDLGYASGINNENTGSYTVENNLWYQTFGTNGSPGGVAFNPGTGGSFTQDHNSFLNAGSSCPSGSGNVCANSAPDPFTNWTGGVFTLASDNADWNNRVSLLSLYDTDAAGNAFSTDRGAYQSGQSAVQPPTDLTATAH